MVVTSKDNPNVRLLAKLLSSKKARNEHGLFAVEGMRSCVDAVLESLNGCCSVYALFYTEDAILNYKNSLPLECFEGVDERKKFVITKEIADKVSLEDNNQGVFVILEKLDVPFLKENLDEEGKYVVLNHLQDPGNIGTLLRTADAVGVSGVIMTNNCCDLYNPKVVRAAMGSLGRVRIFVENDFQRVCETLGEMGMTTLAAVIRDGTSVTEQDFSKPCAVVIGNEGQGLSNQDAELCDGKITIRMNGNINSLNAAVSGAIILWEMFRNRID